MKKAWFALAALAGIAVWSSAVEYSVTQRGGLTAEQCAAMRKVFVDKDSYRAALAIKALGLENDCVAPDLYVARRLLWRFWSLRNLELSIVDYVDRAFLTGRDDAAVPWLATAVAIDFAWDRLPFTDEPRPAVRSPRLTVEIDRLRKSIDGEDPAAIIESLENYISRPPRSALAEGDVVRHLLRRLRLIATRESFYWSGRVDEWRRPPSAERPLVSPRYWTAIACDDDRATRRLAELYLAGNATDESGSTVLRGLLRRADSVVGVPELLQQVIEKLGERATPRLVPAMRRADIASSAEECASAIESEARNARAE